MALKKTNWVFIPLNYCQKKRIKLIIITAIMDLLMNNFKYILKYEY